MKNKNLILKIGNYQTIKMNKNFKKYYYIVFKIV